VVVTSVDLNDVARIGAIDFARRLVQQWQETLGAELLGAYLIGSLAHAGFNRRYSNIDLAIVTEAGLSQDALDSLKSEAVALSGDWGSKVSIFWADRCFSLGRFPPLDRVDFLDHAVALIEREHLTPPRPTLEEIREYLRGPLFTTWVDRARSFAGAETLEPKDHCTYGRSFILVACASVG
jgi:hypothetical protein